MASERHYPLLESIESPDDLKLLPESELPKLCDEVRDFLVRSVAKTGGHLGSSLGTVELTVALHYVFDTPEDRLIWDVGHQAYPHKILTGRRDKMHTMRKKNGLAGFPKRAESPYDCFGVGHSSTSVSAGLGMALAKRLQNKDSRSIAVIGDGAMTAGMVFEALNNAGDWKADMLVVLNDNDMSISPNVGALNKYLTRLLSGQIYTNARESGKRALSAVPPVLEFARRAEEHVKGMVAPGTLFEELGFKYFGPVDGHDIENLVKVLKNLKKLNGPLFLHTVTKKGKGYQRAESDALALHAVTPFDPETGEKLETNAPSSGPTYTQIFSDWLCDMAEQDERLIGITPAMREGSGLVEFEKRFPERYFDVGIAEQHAVTLGAGFACEGKKPVVAIYSTFLQRGYDQLVHDVAIQNLPVLFAIDRAGLVGADGPTHAGSFDYSFMRCLPNMLIMAPADENECRQMLYTGFLHDGPASVRYPRGGGNGTPVESQMTAYEIGKAEVRRRGKRVAILSFGSLIDSCTEIAEQLNYTLVNMRFIKPLDGALLEALAADHDLFITLEENSVAGGAGAAVSEWLSANFIATPVYHIGLPDCYIEQGGRGEVLEDAGLSANQIERQIRNASQRYNVLPLCEATAVAVND